MKFLRKILLNFLSYTAHVCTVLSVLHLHLLVSSLFHHTQCTLRPNLGIPHLFRKCPLTEPLWLHLPPPLILHYFLPNTSNCFMTNFFLLIQSSSTSKSTPLSHVPNSHRPNRIIIDWAESTQPSVMPRWLEEKWSHSKRKPQQITSLP